jgi:acyl carrier protein
MEELLEKLAEILEVDTVDVNKKFTDYEVWDSLAGLSLIAMLDADYGMAMKNKDILAFNSIKDFCEAVLNK